MDVQTLPRLDIIYPEDDMPESQAQRRLVEYLLGLLSYLYTAQRYFVTGNVKIIPAAWMNCSDIVPDGMLVEQEVSDEEQDEMGSWNMNEPNRPAPTVVFEISSESTWPNDIDEKPQHYSRIGVREYFAYDPQRFWRLRNDRRQLRGWRYGPNGQVEEIQPETSGTHQGRLYSQVMGVYLAAGGRWLRMFDPDGQMRQTAEEAAKQAARLEREAWQATEQAVQAERMRAEAAEQAFEAERQRAEAEREARMAERQQAEAGYQAERQRAERLAQKLRELGYSEDI